MGFRDIKKKILDCIRSGCYDHEVRTNIDVKNLFQCGQISEEDIIHLINKTRGDQYDASPHHADTLVTVHLFRPHHEGVVWYIKFYFVEPNAVFISVHI